MKKKLQTLGFLFLLALFSSNPLQADPIDKYPEVKTLRTEIITLIKKPDSNLLGQHKEVVKLSFLVNSNKEVVVVDADTDNNYLENLIKENLNYQQIKTDYVQLNKIYHIKLIFKKNEHK